MKTVNQALSLSRWQTWQRQLPEEQLVNHTGGGASITDGRKGDIKIIIMRKQSGLPAPIWGCYFSFNPQEPPRSHLSIRSCLTRISVLTAWADRLPVRGWADCRLVCGIYWGSQTEGPPIESSTAFQPAPSPASASCKKREEQKNRWWNQQRHKEQRSNLSGLGWGCWGSASGLMFLPQNCDCGFGSQLSAFSGVLLISLFI